MRTAAYQTVRRLRTELNIVPPAGGFRFVSRRAWRRSFRWTDIAAWTEHITGASSGVQQGSFFGRINFAAQAVNVDFD